MPMPGFVLANGISVDVTTTDAVNLYDFGLYNSAGTLVAHTGAVHLASSGQVQIAFLSTPITIVGGITCLGTTGNSTTATVNGYGTALSVSPILFSSVGQATGGGTSGGVLNNSVTIPTLGNYITAGTPGKSVQFSVF
jgi:hypothetical protein